MMISYVTLTAGALCVYIISRVFWTNKLSQFKGPFFASLSDLWLIGHLHSKCQEEPFLDLHKQYGKIVRVGPNRLSFSTVGAVRDIYSASNNLPKTDYYPVMSATSDGYQLDTLFSSIDPAYHDGIKRVVNKYFTVEFTRAYDGHVSENVDVLVDQLRTRFADKSGKQGVFDLALWTNYYTLDTISQIVFGKPYGYMKTSSDVMNLIRDNRFFFYYTFYAGFAPWIDAILLKNPFLMWLNRRGVARFNSWAADHAIKCYSTREKELASGHAWRNDMLDKFMQDRNKHPDEFNDNEVIKLLLALIFAGADTSANLVAATLRYLLTCPRAYKILRAELDRVDSVSYPDVEEVPYLDAVIKETARMCPIVRFLSERMTPPQGMTIDGVAVPGATKVGVSRWAFHRDPLLWGEKPEEFLPERWLDPERNRVMSGRLLHFGVGKFQCIGLHIANRETYKAVHGILRELKLELVEDWKWSHSTLTGIERLLVRAATR